MNFTYCSEMFTNKGLCSSQLCGIIRCYMPLIKKEGSLMYGYVRTHAPELKVREQEYYRAVYCGLCRTMGKCTGQCSRMTLSYDFTYFALVRMALTGSFPAIKARRCLAHPFRTYQISVHHEFLCNTHRALIYLLRSL